MTKVFKTLDEQIDILTGRGLRVEDRNKAKDFLYHNNYYRVSGYSLTLRNHDIFYPGTTFQNIIDIYEFDRELRNILLSAIESIEVNIKSIYAYTFSKAFGGLGYLNSDHFTGDQTYKKIIDKGKEQAKKKLQHEAYLQHYYNDLNEDLPLWAYVDLLTIADISILYSITDKEVKEEISEAYGFVGKKGPEVLGRQLHNITVVRNLCAHGSRLYNRLFITKPSLGKSERALLRQNKDGSIDNSKLFGFILVIKRLLNKQEFDIIKARLVSLSEKYPFVDMKYCGFPENWSECI